MRMQVGDTIAYISKVIFDPTTGAKDYWKLTEGKIKSITINSKGRRVKAAHFYTLDADDIEFNTAYMQKVGGLILTREPFLLTDELRVRVETWIERENGANELKEEER